MDLFYCMWQGTFQITLCKIGGEPFWTAMGLAMVMWHWSHALRYRYIAVAWWRHQMETFSVLLDLYAGNSLVTGEFPSQRPVTRRFDVFFDMRLNKRLSKQPRRRLIDTPSSSLWRHGYGLVYRRPRAGSWEGYIGCFSVRNITFVLPLLC